MDRLDVARRELDVVRLHSGRRQIDHVVEDTGLELFRRPGERIERCDDIARHVRCLLVIGAAAGDDEAARTKAMKRTRRTVARL